MDKTSRIFRLSFFCALSALLSLSLCGCGGSPDDPIQAAADGELALQRGEYAKAARLLAGAAKSDKATVHLFYNLGVAFDKAGKEEKAADAFRQALALSPDDPDTTEYLAILLYRKNDAKGAAQLLTRVLGTRPDGTDRARVLNSLACAELANGRKEMALLRLLEAKRVAPSYAPTFYNLAKLYDSAFQRVPEAIELLERFRSITGQNSPVLGESEKILARLQSLPAPKDNADTFASVFFEARDAYAARNYDRTLEILVTRAIPRWSSAPAAYQLASYALFQLGRLDDIPVFADAAVSAARDSGKVYADFDAWYANFLKMSATTR